MSPNIKASLFPTSTSATGLVSIKIGFINGIPNERKHMVDSHFTNVL